MAFQLRPYSKALVSDSFYATAGFATTEKGKHLKKVTICADASVTGNPGVGGWGVVLQYDDGEIKEVSGTITVRTTNNEAEMRAVLEGIKALGIEQCEVLIKTDSQLAITYLTRKLKAPLPHLLAMKEQTYAAIRVVGHEVSVVKASRGETFRAHQLADLERRKIPAVPIKLVV